MTDSEALQDLQEWVLQEALFNALPPSSSEKIRDFSPIWRQPVVHILDDPQIARPFGEIFSASEPTIRSEYTFSETERAAYRIEGADWLRTYQSKRPDFAVTDSQGTLMLFLDAKRPRLPRSTWDKPKELEYCRALESNTAQQRGFAYIISRNSAEDCFAALRAFQSTKTILGAVFWEDLLPSIYAQLLVSAEGWASRLPAGVEPLRRLRAWKPPGEA